MNNYFVLSICFFLSFGLYAQDNNTSNTPQQEMITDRPDATESPNTVPFKSIQIETGGLYVTNNDQGLKTEFINYNNTLARIGILKNLELRIAWAVSETAERFNNQNKKVIASGFSPLVIGAKVAVTEEKGFLPDIGLLVHMAFPFLASKDYQPETTGISFRFAFAHTVSDNFSLSYNLGARWGDDNFEATYVYSLSFGYSITDKIGAYVEGYGNLPEDSRSYHYWDSGLTYLIKQNIQLDATVGSGFSGDQDLLLGAGLSFRFPY